MTVYQEGDTFQVGKTNLTLLKADRSTWVLVTKSGRLYGNFALSTHRTISPIQVLIIAPGATEGYKTRKELGAIEVAEQLISELIKMGAPMKRIRDAEARLRRARAKRIEP